MTNYLLDNLNRKIAKSLVLAQISSDAGKYKRNEEIFEAYAPKKVMTDSWGNRCEYFGNAETEKSTRKGYKAKDDYIRNALRLISGYPEKSIFRFYVCEDTQQIAKYIVYFDVKIDGKRMQISFHSFDVGLRKYLNGSKASKVRWDRRSSAETAIAISKLLRATR